MPAPPKPARSTPETRRRRKAEARAIKAEFHPELYHERIRDQTQTPVVTADPAKANDYRVTGNSLRTVSRKKLEELNGQPMTSTFRRKPGQRPLQRVRRVDGQRIKTVQQKPMSRGKPLKYQGRRGRRLAPGDAVWRQKIWDIWGSCILTGETGERAKVDAHHCHDKSYRPEWRHESWNGILLRRDLHDLADTVPEFHKVLEEIADEQRSAETGRRPPVTRKEARARIFQKVPLMRKYARSEED